MVQWANIKTQLEEWFKGFIKEKGIMNITIFQGSLSSLSIGSNFYLFLAKVGGTQKSQECFNRES